MRGAEKSTASRGRAQEAIGDGEVGGMDSYIAVVCVFGCGACMGLVMGYVAAKVGFLDD